MSLFRPVKQFPEPHPHVEQSELRVKSYFNYFKQARDGNKKKSSDIQKVEDMTDKFIEGKENPNEVLTEYRIIGTCRSCNKWVDLYSLCLSCGDKTCELCLKEHSVIVKKHNERNKYIPTLCAKCSDIFEAIYPLKLIYKTQDFPYPIECLEINIFKAIQRMLISSANIYKFVKIVTKKWIVLINTGENVKEVTEEQFEKAIKSTVLKTFNVKESDIFKKQITMKAKIAKTLLLSQHQNIKQILQEINEKAEAKILEKYPNCKIVELEELQCEQDNLESLKKQIIKTRKEMAIFYSLYDQLENQSLSLKTENKDELMFSRIIKAFQNYFLDNYYALKYNVDLIYDKLNLKDVIVHVDEEKKPE